MYKRKLSNQKLVHVEVFSNFKGNGVHFINEFGKMGRIHQVNVLLVGYCADGYKRALDSLQKFISSGNQNTLLGWKKLHQIAISIKCNSHKTILNKILC